VFPSIEALSEIESSSRLIVERGRVLSQHAVGRARATRTIPRSPPAGFVLAPNLLITIRFAELAVFDAVAEKVRKDESIRSAAGVFTTLAGRSCRSRWPTFLERMASELDKGVPRPLFRSDFDQDEPSGPLQQGRCAVR